jgi:hypothetical protein
MNLLGNFTSLPSNLSITLPLIYRTSKTMNYLPILPIPSCVRLSKSRIAGLHCPCVEPTVGAKTLGVDRILHPRPQPDSKNGTMSPPSNKGRRRFRRPSFEGGGKSCS